MPVEQRVLDIVRIPCDRTMTWDKTWSRGPQRRDWTIFQPLPDGSRKLASTAP
jgi:hypothetical protein